MTNKNKSKFVSKYSSKSKHEHPTENSKYDYLYLDEENRSALFSKAKLGYNVSKKQEPLGIEWRDMSTRRVKSKLIRDFILSAQKFRPDFIEVWAENDNLYMSAKAVEDEFESKIRLGRFEGTDEFRSKLDFESFKLLKYLKKGKIDIHVNDHGLFVLEYNKYDLGFSILSS
jgi:hypothetical protein